MDFRGLFRAYCARVVISVAVRRKLVDPAGFRSPIAGKCHLKEQPAGSKAICPRRCHRVKPYTASPISENAGWS